MFPTTSFHVSPKETALNRAEPIADDSAQRHHPRLAANPIAYRARNGTVDNSRAALDQAFAELADIGFTAIKADVPEGMTADEYRAWISGYGLAPTLSLFSSPFDETVDITDEMEHAKRFADAQVALGLDRTMVSSMSVPARMVQPAIGADFNKDRLALAVENCGIICEVLQSQGLRPLHHPQIGGVFETEAEIIQLLDTLGAGVIGFGPDTGHLCWAGIDQALLIRRYADRIGGIHIKDCFPDYLDPASREGLNYHEVEATKRLWAEPGRGVIDFDAVTAAMPEDYDGDYMIEVVEPSVDSPYDSYKMAFDWAREALRLAKP
jgi:inosose dehydratase